MEHIILHLDYSRRDLIWNDNSNNSNAYWAKLSSTKELRRDINDTRSHFIDHFSIRSIINKNSLSICSYDIKTIIQKYNIFLNYMRLDTITNEDDIVFFYYLWAGVNMRDTNIVFDWLSNQPNAAGRLITFNQLTFIEFYDKETSLLFHIRFGEYLHHDN